MRMPLHKRMPLVDVLCCAQAHHELSGSMVSKVLESMDVHGRLTLEEFLAIADVSTWATSSSPSCLAQSTLR